MKKYLQLKSAWYIGFVSAISALLIILNISFFPYTLSIELSSPTNGNIQIFYSSNGHYSENNSLLIPVEASNNYNVYSAKLTQQNIKHIRIDPPGDFNIKSISLFNSFHSYKYEGNKLFEKVKPLHDIESISIIENQTVGKINGDDPFMHIVGLPIINDITFLKYLGLFVVVFLFSFAFFYILWNYYLKYDYSHDDKKPIHLSIPNSLFKTLLIIIFAWFAYQTIFYAISIANHIAPDESYHLLLSIFQSETISLHNHDTPRSFYLGAISVRPFLYHLIMGKLLMLNVFGLSTLIYLRLLNVLISLITLYLTFLLAKEITKNKLIQLAVLIIQTNVLMFVFISSMVSYDNLTNLISTASFLVLITFLKNYSRFKLLLLLITMMAGVLTKISYGPIVIIQIAVLINYSKTIYKNRYIIFSNFYSIRDGALLILLIVLFGLNVNLYARNLITYGQIQPKTVKVFGHEKAYKYYSQYQRSYDLKSTESERPRMPFTKYVVKYVNRSGQTIFGIMGHKNLFRTTNEAFSFCIIGLLSIIIYALKYKKKSKNSTLIIVSFSFISYALVILFTNYLSYQSLGLFGLALQGRYNFPVIALVNIFIAYNLLFYLQDRAKTILLIALSIFFVYNNYFWFISHAGSIWY